MIHCATTRDRSTQARATYPCQTRRVGDSTPCAASLVQAIAEAGLFQLHLPRSMGGLELPPLTSFRVIEEFSRVDGSVGWCTMIASCQLLCRQAAPRGGTRPFWPAPRRPHRWVPASGRQGLYGRWWLSRRGRWDFASGVDHARWLLCTCTVMDGDKPRLAPDGTPELRHLLVPAADATIVDTWSVVGMCGTGSHDFMVENAFVPAAQLFLNRIARGRGSALPSTPPPGGRLDRHRGQCSGDRAWRDRCLHRVGDLSRLKQCADAAMQPSARSGSVGRGRAILSAARAYVVDTVGTAWTAFCDEVPDPSREIAQARLAITHGMHEAVRAVDLVFHAAGTNALYRKFPLERYFRDIHAAVQHAAGLPSHYEAAGQALLGLRPNGVGW